MDYPLPASIAVFFSTLLVAWLRVQAPEVGSGIPLAPTAAEGV
jgi:hypothetical protein